MKRTLPTAFSHFRSNNCSQSRCCIGKPPHPVFCCYRSAPLRSLDKRIGASNRSTSGGLVSLPLFYGIIRRCLGPTACVIAMLLFIVLDPLVYYSAEAKQYGLDVTIALAIVWSAIRLGEEPLMGGG